MIRLQNNSMIPDLGNFIVIIVYVGQNTARLPWLFLGVTFSSGQYKIRQRLLEIVWFKNQELWRNLPKLIVVRTSERKDEGRLW